MVAVVEAPLGLAHPDKVLEPLIDLEGLRVSHHDEQ